MADSEKMWKVKNSKEIFRIGFVRFREDQCELPDGRIMPHYYTLEINDWVNVIPLTQDKKMVLVGQYRHSAQEYRWEIPGGAIDAKNQESPDQTALRELKEETGFSGQIFQQQKHRPNPALQNNWMHTFLIKNCELVGKQELDPYEDIEVKLVNWQELNDLIKKGQINHSIVLASLFLFWEELRSEMS